MKLNRRTFIKQTAATAAAGILATAHHSAWAKPIGSNEAVRVAVVGLGIKGSGHIKHLLTIDNVRITALCDVDPKVLDRSVQKLKENQIEVFACTDPRHLLERSDVDAVVIATPNHWHALLTIWACQAGKDVYVEKPIAHNVWEGRKMIQAAAKYNRVVQAGTQMRSDISWPDIIEYLRQGHLGKIQYIHTLRFKIRKSIGKVSPWYPDWLDYDLFCGRAPMVPLRRKRLHYNWHWLWETGNGDLGNLGIHVFDIARLIAGHSGYPKRVISIGQRFVVDDVGQTPNTQLTLFDYPEIPIIVENRGLPAETGANHLSHIRGIRRGLIVQCEGGYYAGQNGGWIYDNDGKKIKQFIGDGGKNHMSNFLEAVKSRKTQNLKAPIEVGQTSNVPPLYGNISYRLGQEAGLKEIRETLQEYPFALSALDGIEKHLTANQVDLKQTPLNLGPWLTIDPGTDKIGSVEGAKDPQAAMEQIKFLTKDTYRPPYIIPEEV